MTATWLGVLALVQGGVARYLETTFYTGIHHGASGGQL
jgi:hypothetical protein